MAPRRKVALTLGAAALFALASGILVGARVWSKERTPVASGERLARESGCYACHASSEQEARANFRASSSGAFRAKSLPTFWESGIDRASRIKEWIRDGAPSDERERHERLLIQMPAYGDGFLSEAEIDSIAAWILAKGMTLTGASGNADLELPETVDVASLGEEELLVYGDRLSRRFGCYQCHGELGQGGVANPRSLKGYIPGFAGEDFLELTADGDFEQVRHWIAKGRGDAIEKGVKGWFARRFFEGQATGMPAYEKVAEDEEIQLLTRYLLFLNKRGPLDAEAVESVNQAIANYVYQETQYLTE